ncbi:MAG TPA: AMIN domain-containing protein, partial [Polyangiaceae bacterium]
MLRNKGEIRKWGAGWVLALVVAVVPASARAAAVNHVQSVKVSPRPIPNGGVGADVTIQTSDAPRYTARLLDGGKRLLIDISEADVAFADGAIHDQTGVVGGVLTQAFRDPSGSVVRVAITLTEPVTYRIRPQAAGLLVSLAPSDSERQWAASPSTSGASALRIQDVRFVHTSGADTITIDLSNATPFTSTNGPGAKSRLEIRGATLPTELERTLDLSPASTRVRAVSTFRSGDKVVLEAERASDVLPQAALQGRSLVWTFARAADVPSSETGVAPDGGTARRTRTVAREPAMVGVPVVETSWRDDASVFRARSRDTVVETRSEPREAGAFLPAIAAQQQGRYTGRRIDLDLKDADIHNVLRLLADVGRVNVITSDNVSGTVTIKMRNVPWDQALDVVLQSKNLGMVRQGNLLRVAPLADLEKEREMAIARRKQELELAPVETR